VRISDQPAGRLSGRPRKGTTSANNRSLQVRYEGTVKVAAIDDWIAAVVRTA
jgi:hypothetical protein